MSFDLIETGLLQGLILSLVAYAIMIPFRFIDFSDLTAEGAYPLGGAIYATMALIGFPLFVSIPFAMIAAGSMGILTSQIAHRFRVNSLFAGIITSIMIYSINLRLLEKPNVSLFNKASLFNFDEMNINLLMITSILSAVIVPFYLFLQTNSGLKMRAVGLNRAFAKFNHIASQRYITGALFLASSFSGLAGALMVDLQHYMDIGMGVGIVIHGLAALMLGEALLGKNSIKKQLIAPVLGAILYQEIQGFVLSCGLQPSDLKFFTAVILLVVLSLQRRTAYDVS